MLISLSRTHFPVTTLGPGKRIGIWFQGCSLCCKGCLSPDTWERKTASTTVDAIIQQIQPWFSFADGITISGGEPFEQPEALYALLTALRQQFSGDIFIYSGYHWNEIEPQVTKMSGLIDALMSGRYQVENTQSLMLRGSDNQQLHCLTAMGRARFSAFDRSVTEEDKVLDLSLDNQGRIYLTGIPQKGDMARLREVLAQQDAQLKQIKR
ncbi:4Fe-4S cluster-binding domain-containing protein [Proteus columbae]|uniref:4Fe-4S single cluster domain-containing protein n=1 Tax=Proteus columbae TaxID=1987580 RepID=UPI0018C4D0BC|nr:4Fe-4S cluster-binding domain-containing protein [Proteus columbae]MBG6028316.1 radical SAM protein [Proteus mirabilis]MBG6049032.1 radical SAM protein [Proteus mirabilis]